MDKKKKWSSKNFFAFLGKAKIRVLSLLFLVSPALSYAESFDWKPRYMGEIHAGYGTTSKVNGMDLYMGRTMLGTMQGVALGRYGDIGVGVDAVMLTHYYRGEGLRFAVNPSFIVRPTYPISEKFSVFLTCSMGAMIPVVNMEGGKTDFTFEFGPGIKYKRLNISCGMQNIGSGKGSTTFFAKLGIYLGKQ